MVVLKAMSGDGTMLVEIVLVEGMLLISFVW